MNKAEIYRSPEDEKLMMLLTALCWRTGMDSVNQAIDDAEEIYEAVKQRSAEVNE